MPFLSYSNTSYNDQASYQGSEQDEEISTRAPAPSVYVPKPKPSSINQSDTEIEKPNTPQIEDLKQNMNQEQYQNYNQGYSSQSGFNNNGTGYGQSNQIPPYNRTIAHSDSFNQSSRPSSIHNLNPASPDPDGQSNNNIQYRPPPLSQVQNQIPANQSPHGYGYSQSEQYTNYVPPGISYNQGYQNPPSQDPQYNRPPTNPSYNSGYQLGQNPNPISNQGYSQPLPQIAPTLSNDSHDQNSQRNNTSVAQNVSKQQIYPQTLQETQNPGYNAGYQGSPRPDFVQGQPRPGYNQSIPGPGYNQGTPRPDFDQEPPRPGFNQGPPTPGFSQGPPRPGFDQRPTGPGYNQVPLGPGFDQGPSRPGFDQGPPRPGFDQGPPRPGFDQGPPRPGFDQGPPRPGFNQGPPRPGFDQGPPRPGFDQGPPRPRFDQGSPKPGFDQVPPRPGLNTVPSGSNFGYNSHQSGSHMIPSGPGYGPNNFRPQLQNPGSNSKPPSIYDSKLDSESEFKLQDTSLQNKKDSDKKKWMNIATGSALGIGAATAIGAGIYALKKKGSDSVSDSENDPEKKNDLQSMSVQGNNAQTYNNNKPFGNDQYKNPQIYNNNIPNEGGQYNSGYNNPNNNNGYYQPPSQQQYNNQENNQYQYSNNPPEYPYSQSYHQNNYNPEKIAREDYSRSNSQSSSGSESDDYSDHDSHKHHKHHRKGGRRYHDNSGDEDEEYDVTSQNSQGGHCSSDDERASSFNKRPYTYDQNDVREPDPSRSSVNSQTPIEYPAIYEDADDIIKFGTVLAFKHMMTGNFLQSKDEIISESGSGQQLVYCDSHDIQDDDAWQVMPANHDVPTPGLEVTYGTVIRLQHVQTGKFLHSHYHFTCGETGQNEVTCFGGPDYSDDNDHWIVERFGNIDEGEVWDRHNSVVLRHYVSGMALHSHDIKYSDGLQSVTCFGPGDENNDKWKPYFTV
ncbi:Stromal cell-derived factor 2-like protein [Smittium mucronatum]|uniref:Stromal cell-derived factor 2-like protein n=1 Tax=Smittium mucronatum TaxID=133383 RepID=A0A1R0GUX0_9FUNG|nr:Stromal cell-derived factor 2-like protein [Smittium mucronatum]